MFDSDLFILKMENHCFRDVTLHNSKMKGYKNTDKSYCNHFCTNIEKNVKFITWDSVKYTHIFIYLFFLKKASKAGHLIAE